MTFIISAATKNLAIQVSDTRLTNALNGDLIDDFSVKMLVVQCDDARLLMSFTGLATIQGKKVDRWLATRLVKFECWKKVFLVVTEFIRAELSAAAVNDQNVSKYGLEIIIIGLGVSPLAERQPAIAWVTNISERIPQRNDFRPIHPPRSNFERILLWTDSNFIGIAGAISLTASQILKINGMRRNFQKEMIRFPAGSDPRMLLDKIVAMLRFHRECPDLSPLIGNYCVAAAIQSNFTMVAGSYGPPGGALLEPIVVRHQSLAAF